MTDFLYDAGTSGYIATPFNLLSTELNTLASASVVVSSVGGTSGVFSQSNTVSGLVGAIYFSAGGAFTPTAGGFLAGWFLASSDGGTTFEKFVSNVSPPRAADFVIPFMNQAYASGELAFSNGILVPLPPTSFKIALFQAAGVTLPASGNLVKLGPVAVKY